ncbi:dihydrofolate reductase family protein [Pseudarthrobacter enclensis]|uniref:dihydrofolate reductase family protein n=1 Tax=Pseudarthrobacter enclensis TaxID=993070 RepID=UPI0036AFF41E
MSLVRVHNFSISLDGFGAGEGQSLETPFGHAGSRLMEWAFETRTFREMGLHGTTAGSRGVDEAFASQWGNGVGVEIMGRNKFGPQRGPWQDEEWKGWWGDNPVFHTPVVVLTHHPRPVLEMEAGTTFHFVDADPAAALEQARALANGGDVRIGGGAATVRQFLEADLIDHLHVVVVPIILGRGERLWDGLEGLEERFDIEATPSPSGVVHMVFSRKAAPQD